MMQPTELGLAPRENQGRDAIHVAVLPIQAEEQLFPGQRVLIGRASDVFVGRPAGKGVGIGIVDPFRSGSIAEGTMFWLMLDPGSIQDMRHHWSHPSVPEDTSTANADHATAVSYMDRFANKLGITYKEALQAGDDFTEHRGGHTLDYDTPDIVYDEGKLYWEAWSTIQGRPAPSPEELDSAPFGCAC